MSSSTIKQVGGDHYGGTDYQHWDWVCNTKMHYLPACASKYVSRHRKKNGKEDLEKAVSYIAKAEEQKLTGAYLPRRFEFFWRFVLENRLTLEESEICFYLMEGQWQQARTALFELIQSV